MNNKLCDSYGTEINVGDHIEETISYVYPIGHDRYPDGHETISDQFVGIVEYDRGCHILNFAPLNNGRLGTYTFPKRWPFYITIKGSNVIYKSLWKVVSDQG